MVARGRVDVKAWEKAVEELGKYNGIVYNKLLGMRDYIEKIVKHICDRIISDVKLDVSHVQGKSRIFKVLDEKVKSVDHNEKYKCKMVGIVGLGGIGKTTTCKVLCNKLSDEYEGRVCYIELETPTRVSNSSSVQSQATSPILVQSLQKLVIRLADKNPKFVQTLDEGECKDILRKSNKRKRSFIALDNIWDNDKSITQAKTILEAPKFHKETLVIVTSRSESTLEKLGIRGDACLEMPDLREEDAVKLFLYQAARGKKFESEQEKRDILQCIKRCYFHKGGETGWHYHPLALHSLGAQISQGPSCLGERPSEWVRNLPTSSKSKGGGGNRVSDILKSSFEILEQSEQSLFMDLVIYRPFTEVNRCNFESVCVDSNYEDCNWDPAERFEFEQSGDGSSWADVVEWLCLVHEVEDYEIKSTLDTLKRKGLLQDVDWTSGRISVHDLYMDFAESELKGKLDKKLYKIKHQRP